VFKKFTLTYPVDFEAEEIVMWFMKLGIDLALVYFKEPVRMMFSKLFSNLNHL
jgi:hypothetical protein